MIFIRDLILVFWAIYFIYWLMNWRNVKPTEKRFRSDTVFRGTGTIIVIFIVILSKKFRLLPACQFILSGCNTGFFYIAGSSMATLLIGCLLVLAGLITALAGRKTLADNWSSRVELKKGHTLVTGGIYGYIRHPIYTGMMFMTAGTLLAFLSVFAFRIKKEEELMQEVFRQEFKRYKERTKAVIPFIL